MKITTSNGMTVELSDSFTGEVVVNGVSFKISASQTVTQQSEEKESVFADNKFHDVWFSWGSGAQKIPFIKFLRQEFNLGLKEAKEMSERGQFTYSSSFRGKIVCKGSTQRDRVKNAIREFGYILC